ncbi:MAG: hypothetical protein A4E65_01578 [Syntrophorhabdus sp. PtaU1.Bin153]|nr:MAG: hypothetical protein A4E65_01578 [Syntrophorhabdus sp. PtaU1.Bin153]
MRKVCVNSDCGKEIDEDSVFCGYCGAEQGTHKKNDNGPIRDNTESKTSRIFYADDYEVVRQFDPVITATKDKVSLESLLAIFQEVVKSKDYPFHVDTWRQQWRTEGDKGKERIIIQPTHDLKWKRIIFSIAVEQLGTDTTIKLGVLRKNEMAEFYYSTLESAGAFSRSSTPTSAVAFNINWQDEKKYRPHIDNGISYFAEAVEDILSTVPAKDVPRKTELNGSIRSFITSFLSRHPDDANYFDFLAGMYAEKDAIEIKIEETQKNIPEIEKPIPEIQKRVTELNEKIASAQESVKSLYGKNGMMIGLSIAAYVVLCWIGAGTGAGAILGASFIVGPGIYILYRIIRAATKSSTDSECEQLRQQIAVCQNEIGQIRSKRAEIENAVSKLKSQSDDISNTVDARYNQLLEAISDITRAEFNTAMQNEIKWRTPSFVDEELEQLISVVKNVFNQTTAKLTGKRERKDFKMQTTMGLGGMGFEE